MLSRKKMIIYIIVCVLILLSISGCWNRRELNTLAILMGMGIDKAQETGKIELTAQVIKPGELKQEARTGEKAYWNIKKTGSTVFNTIRGFTFESSRKIFLQHSQVLIFGRELAEEGVQNHLDFFIRDHETRLTVDVLVAEGKAADILDVKSEIEKIPANNIANLVEAYGATSQSISVSLDEFIKRLMSKTFSPIAPIIRVNNDGEKQSVFLEGTAVFKRAKMVGELNRIETRGLLWVIDKIRSGIIVINSPDGEGNVEFEIIRASSKIIPKIENNRISLTVKIKEEGNIGSQNSPGDLELEHIEYFENEKKSVIKNEVMAAISKAQELNADIFGFGEAIYRKYPKQWKELEENWDKIFPELEVEIIVEARVKRSGVSLKPVIPGKE
ncbi:MAG TPA: Ger(x)C family spore germination protein [Peptococcaceae bacterium]|nr:Ger(x)C family spore germination protein [Peptococcaceae bacterium]